MALARTARPFRLVYFELRLTPMRSQQRSAWRPWSARWTTSAVVSLRPHSSPSSGRAASMLTGRCSTRRTDQYPSKPHPDPASLTASSCAPCRASLQTTGTSPCESKRCYGPHFCTRKAPRHATRQRPKGLHATCRVSARPRKFSCYPWTR
jgi:hypothetical protein